MSITTEQAECFRVMNYEMDKLKKENEKLQQNMKILLGDIFKKLENKLEEKESAISAMKENVEYLKRQNSETRQLKERENESLNINIQNLFGQLKKSEQILKTKEECISMLKQEVEQSNIQSNENRTTISALQDQLEYMKSQVSETQKLKEDNESLFKNMHNILGALLKKSENKQENNGTSISDIREENESLIKNMHSILGEHLKESQMKLKYKETAISALQEQVDIFKKQHTRELHNHEVQELTKEIKSLKINIEDLNRALNESEKKKTYLRERLRFASQRLMSEKSVVAELHAVIIALQNMNS